jgi:hypothetical protein
VDPDTLDPRLVHPYSVSVIAQSYGFKIAVLSTDKDKVVYALTQNGAE